ncbi:MAG: hypothetical protein AB7L84_15345 [Acidimicrobiia bacterium]
MAAALLAVLAVLGTVVVPTRPAAAQADRPGRLLVVSMPGLTWSDVRALDLPELEAFFEGAAIADMAPRSVAHRSTPGAAYLTISAGTRTTSDETVDGQVLALDEGDLASPAAEIFERRTGVRPTGEYVALGWPTLLRLNDRQPYDAEPGLLAETLADAGVGTSAIGNADGRDAAGPSYERQVGLALADTRGQVPDGELSPGLLLRPDEARPFGVRTDPDAVQAAFDAAWGQDGPTARKVVLVEASDLARVIRYRPVVDAGRYAELREQALAEADALFGRLVDEVDPERDAVLVVAPYLLRSSVGLSVAALRTPDGEAGYLRTATTQRAGIVSLVDVAPTILATLGVVEPDAMEGRPFEVVSSSTSLAGRVDHLVQVTEASRFREFLLTPTSTFVVLAVALVSGLATCAVAGRWGGRARAAIRGMALTVLFAMPVSYLARAFPLEDLGRPFYWAVLVGGSVVLAALATLAGRRAGRPRLGLALALATMLGVLVADVTTGSNLSLSAAFGYSPTGNSRLYGISNYSFGQVAAASCLLAGFVASRWPTRRGRLAAVGLLVATLVVLGVPTWGSDVGGVLAFTPTVLVFAALAYGYRVRFRDVVVAGVATVAAITAFGLVDLSRPPTQRAHLGRLFERVGKEGIEPLVSIMERKLLANLRVSTSSVWVVAIPIGVAFWLFLRTWPDRPLRRLRARLGALHAALVAAAVAAVLGSLVNDSGAIVGGVTVAVVTAALAHLAVEPPPRGEGGEL